MIPIDKALQILDKVCAVLPGTREEHILRVNALDSVRQAVYAPPPLPAAVAELPVAPSES